MNHGSLFSGIGGFDLASEWMGWNNIFHCEWEQFPKSILQYYWPKAISYGNIKETDFTIHNGKIDILTGGFPCQPYSQAGKRKGKEDDRHLWPEMLRAIREIQPTWVVGENVRGLVNWSGGLVFEEVCADLEAEGYEVQPFMVPASAVNAPHQRERIWFVAYSASNGYDAESKEGDNEVGKNNKQSRTQRKRTAEGFGNERNVTYTESQRLERREKSRKDKRKRGNEINGRHFNSSRLHKQTSWQNFPTESPICSGDDGLPSELDGITFPKWRNESIKGYGNAVVPQVVFEKFKAIEKYNQLTKQ